MIIKITYPYKDTMSSLKYKSVYLKTDDKTFIDKLQTSKNPIDIGVILSENEEKYKIIDKTKEDIEIEIDEVLANPDLRLNLPLDLL